MHRSVLLFHFLFLNFKFEKCFFVKGGCVWLCKLFYGTAIDENTEIPKIKQVGDWLEESKS